MTLDQVGRAAGDELRRTTRDSVDPVAGLADLHRLRAARRRARLAAALLVVGVVGWLGLQTRGSGSTLPAAPTPTATSTAAPTAPDINNVGAPLLPPLCGADRIEVVGTPEGRSRKCPTDIVAGIYRSAILTVHLAYPFTVTLPDGWRASALNYFAGVDLRAGATAPGAQATGVTVVPYATPHGSSPFWSQKRLRNWLEHQPSLVLSGAHMTRFAENPAWQVDVRPAADARFTTHCRLAPRCLPLLGSSFPSSLRHDMSVVELAPDTTSRLIVVSPDNLGLPATIWIWNTAGEAGRHALDVVASLSFEPGRDPLPRTPGPTR